MSAAPNRILGDVPDNVLAAAIRVREAMRDDVDPLPGDLVTLDIYGVAKGFLTADR